MISAVIDAVCGGELSTGAGYRDDATPPNATKNRMAVTPAMAPVPD